MGYSKSPGAIAVVLELRSLPLMQRDRVRFPVGSISWLRILRDFSSTVRQVSGNFGHIRPRVPFGHHNFRNHIHLSTDGDGL